MNVIELAILEGEVLIGMEESQAIANAFRDIGIKAFSCDYQQCSGGHPEYHLQMDFFEAAKLRKWKIIICHPTCTYLTVSNNNAMAHGCAKYTKKQGHKLRAQAIADFMKCTEIDCQRWCIENPIGIMSTRYRKPNQTIQPFNFGHGETKATCLWLRGLPRLNGFNVVAGREQRIWKMSPGKDRTKERSKTYSGIAASMATQWAYLVKN